MNNVFRISLFFFLTALLVSSSFARQNERYHRSFLQPCYHGQRLNYCMQNNRQCGLFVATRYCQMMGYDHADQEIIAYNVGLTHYLSTANHCTGWRCNGFKAIRCVRKMSHHPPKPYHFRTKRFAFPRFGDYRVNWCYDGKKQCGRRVAQSFCRRMGYMKVTTFTIQKHIAATKALGNQKLCFGQQCNAFAEIICYR